MGTVYVSDNDDDQALLTPEISKVPMDVPTLQVYIERYLNHIRDDLLRMMSGTWRLIVVNDHLEFQQFSDATGTFVRKFRIREDAT